MTTSKSLNLSKCLFPLLKMQTSDWIISLGPFSSHFLCLFHSWLWSLCRSVISSNKWEVEKETQVGYHLPEPQCCDLNKVNMFKGVFSRPAGWQSSYKHGLSGRQSGIKSGLYHLLPVWPWASANQHEAWIVLFRQKSKKSQFPYL